MRNLILLAHAISQGMALGYSVHPEKYAQILRLIVFVLLNTGSFYPSACSGAISKNMDNKSHESKRNS